MQLTILLLAALSAHATTVTFTVTSGLSSPVAGAQTTTFDGLSSATASPYTGNSAVFSWSGFTAPFVTGTSVGCNAAPLGDSTTYMVIGGCGGPTSVTASFHPTDYAGFLLGSADAYNGVSIWDGSTLVASYTGAQLIPPGNGDWSLTGYVNFHASGGTFDSAVFTSQRAALEMDNFSVSETPEPGTLAMIGVGLLALGCRLRKAI